MKTKKKKQLTLYDVRRRHLLIRRKRKGLIYRIGRVIRNSSLPKGKWPRGVQVDIIRIAGMSADAAAALFAMSTCIRVFNQFKGKNRA